MKNLKKVLSLGLALVMLLGMFTVASAAETKKTASDLTDWNTVSHKDAVSLMVDLGIIVGTDKGTFEPTGNIDRASWAKMVYFAATGTDDADAYLGTASGLGDIAGNWAESYISFLKANNYISGDNFGNYNPSNNVTVAEACKMMLTVLGYDAEDRGYQNNTAWAGNIMTDAKRNGLMDNVDKAQTALVPLTRENAAEIVLNALNANMVEGIPQWDNGNRYITTYSKLYTLGYDVFNMVKVTATVSGVDGNGYAKFSAITAPVIGTNPWGITSSLDGKVKATADLIGEDVNVYVKTEGSKWDEKTGEQNAYGTFQSVISSSAAKADVTPVKVITGGVVWDEITTRSSSNYVASKVSDTVDCYLNGEPMDSDADTFRAAMGLRGTVVEFYLDDKGEIGTIKAYKYTVDKVDGAVATKTQADGTLQVRIPGVLTGYVDADKVTGWQGLEVDDVVLFYTTKATDNASAQSWTIEKAEMISGKVRNVAKNGTMTINGQSYRASEQDRKYTDVSVTEDALKAWTNQADEFNFWLDKNGSIIAATQITESMDNSKVCLVIETEVTDGGLGTTGSLAANLLFVDGSTEIVNVSKVYDKGELKAVVDTVTNSARQISTSDADKILVGTGRTQPDALKKFFNYRSTSTGYELTELSFTNNARDWENVVTAGEASIVKASNFAKAKGTTTDLGSFDMSADLTTTFIIGKENVNDGTMTYSVAKGFRELHEMDTRMITAIAMNADPTDVSEDSVNKVAKYVYLDTTAFKDDAPDGYIFIVDNNYKSDDELYEDGVKVFNIIDTDGTATTMRVDSSLANTLSATTETSTLNSTPKYLRKFFQIGSIDENRVVSALGLNGDGQPAEMSNVTALGNGVIKLANGKSYDYDDATKFVFVDMNWADDTDDKSNKIGVREPAKDIWVLQESGSFDPEGFFDAAEVYAGKDGDKTTNDKGATYVEVLASVIVPDTITTTADYVYVVRYLW